jgi:ABC-type uncharacterized transport system substrate-binding protein
MLSAENDPFTKSLLATMLRGLADLGWVQGRSLQVDLRFGNADVARIRVLAKELVEQAPDVIAANGTAAVVAIQQQTQSVPIVFLGSGDPVRTGLVKSLARPGGNTTGFGFFPDTIGGKWVQLLKGAAPRLTRITVPRTSAAISSNLPSAQAAASTLGVEAVRLEVQDRTGLERAIKTFASEPNGGFIMAPEARIGDDSELYVELASRYRLPALYYDRGFVVRGGLMSYAPDTSELFLGGARYIDRILRGEKPGDLPVQFTNRYFLAVNLRTAGALGLDIPPMMLALADEVVD